MRWTADQLAEALGVARPSGLDRIGWGGWRLD